MTKSELRKSYLERRAQLSLSDRSELSEKIAGNFFQNFDLEAVTALHCYISIEKFNEINTAPIFERIWKDFPQIMTAVPRVNYRTNELESPIFGPDVELTEGRWSIPEPFHDVFVEDTAFDIVLVPLVCFDERGHRVGYGKGYYDRFLRRCREDCLKIGLSYFSPTADIADTHNADVQLNYCITPDGIFHFIG